MWKQKRRRLAVVIFLPLFFLITLFTSVIYYLYYDQIDGIGDYFLDQAFEVREYEAQMKEDELFEKTITEEEWETLSQFEIDEKLKKSGHDPIGDPQDPFYKLKPQELEQQFEIFEKSILEKEALIEKTITEEDWETLSQFEIDEKLKKAGLEPMGDPKDPYYKLTPLEIEKIDFESEINPISKIVKVLFLEPAIHRNNSENGETVDLDYSQLPYISIDQIENLESTISKRFFIFTTGLFVLAACVLGGIAWYLAVRSMKPLEEAFQKQKEFVEHVSHELRTPLTMMKTEAEVLLKSDLKLTNESREFAQNVIQDIDYLNVLTTQLLQLSQLDRQAKNKNRIVEINSEWSRLKKRFLTRARQEKKKFSMVSIPSSLSLKVPLIGFEALLQIVLDNAFKYTKAKDSISVEVEDCETKFVITVSDTGNGISEIDLPFIFNRFYRADKSRTTGGFGLGLSLAKESLEVANGNIFVESEVGKGSQFKLHFLKK